METPQDPGRGADSSIKMDFLQFKWGPFLSRLTLMNPASLFFLILRCLNLWLKENGSNLFLTNLRGGSNSSVAFTLLALGTCLKEGGLGKHLVPQILGGNLMQFLGNRIWSVLNLNVCVMSMDLMKFCLLSRYRQCHPSSRLLWTPGGSDQAGW